MRIVFIGAGSAARQHVGALAGLGAEVTGIFTPSRTSAEKLAVEYEATAYESLDLALDAGRPHAVYICVPPFAHGKPEKAVIARGLPFFVETPVSVDPAVAQDVSRLVKEAGIVTGTGYHWRCLDTVERARERLLEQPVVLATGAWLDKRPTATWWDHRDQSGGQVIEQLTHVLDVARVLLGEATEVYAAGAQVDPQPEKVDDATAATVRFSSGAVATFTATSILAGLREAGLRTYSPGLVTHLTETSLVFDSSAQRQAFTPSEDPRVAVDREFLEAVRGEREATRAPYQEALRSHRLGWAMTESARLQAPVDLTEPVE